MALDVVYRELLKERRVLSDQLARIDSAIKTLGFDLPESKQVVEVAPVSQVDGGTALARRAASALSQRSKTDGEGTKARLLRILRGQPDREFAAPALLNHLKESGWETNSQNPRNVVVSTLGQLAKAGEIHKVREGVYVYAAAPTLDDEPADFIANDAPGQPPADNLMASMAMAGASPR
jgi:hypothetical protein